MSNTTDETREVLSESEVRILRGFATGKLLSVCDSHEALRAQLTEAQATVFERNKEIHALLARADVAEAKLAEATARAVEAEKSLHRFQHGHEIESDYLCKAAQEMVGVIHERNLWRDVAMRIGEGWAASGPTGYYDFTAHEWIAWALKVDEQRRKEYSAALARVAELEARPATCPTSELDVRWQNLVQAWDAERKERQVLAAHVRELREAGQERLRKGHNDTCSAMLVQQASVPCDCGQDLLATAIARTASRS